MDMQALDTIMWHTDANTTLLTLKANNTWIRSRRGDGNGAAPVPPRCFAYFNDYTQFADFYCKDVNFLPFPDSLRHEFPQWIHRFPCGSTHFHVDPQLSRPPTWIHAFPPEFHVDPTWKNTDSTWNAKEYTHGIQTGIWMDPHAIHCGSAWIQPGIARIP
jgi:hypothetical protein